MGQKVTFDPINKIIQVTQVPVNGEISLDVKIDLYSDMKEDWRSDANLMKYRPPISAVGGNPLPGSKALGTTFFIDPAWKIRPYEANHRFLVNGNLYSTDGTSPYTTTIGSYNVLLENSVSSLVDSTVQQLSEIEHGTFNNGVTVDVLNGLPGTAYPRGNTEYPVNNIPDAVTIAQSRGFSTLYIKGNIVLDSGDDVSGFMLIGQNAARSNITINAAAETLGCEIREAYITGNLDGGTIIRNSVIDSLNYINGFVFQCMIAPGTISLGGANVANFFNCYSGVPGQGTPIIDCNGLTNDQDTPLAIRGYNGGIQLEDLTGGGNVSIDLASGQVKINLATCTNGAITVRGDGKVYDTQGNHLMSGVYGGLTLYNEANYGGHVHEMWQALGLDPNNPQTGDVIDEINNIPTRVWNHTQ